MVHVINVGVLVAALTVGLLAVQADSHHRTLLPVASRQVQSLDSGVVNDLKQDRTDAYAAAQDQARSARDQAAQASPTKTPAQAANSPAAPVPTGAVPDIIRAAFAPLGSAVVTWALRVAKCESGYNPNALNPSGHMGLFQFDRQTWNGTP